MKRAIWVLTMLWSASAVLGAESSGGTNAAVIYRQAFAALPQLNKAEFDLFRKPPADAAAAVATALLAKSETALGLGHQAAAQRQCNWELDYTQGPELLLPHIAKARDLGRLFCLRARVRIASGDLPGGLADLLDVMCLSRHISADPILICMLVAYSLEKSASDVIQKFSK